MQSNFVITINFEGKFDNISALFIFKVLRAFINYTQDTLVFVLNIFFYRPKILLLKFSTLKRKEFLLTTWNLKKTFVFKLILINL